MAQWLISLLTFWDRRSRLINTILNIILLSICLISSVLLILLFTSAEAYKIPSFLDPGDPSNVTPAVAVGLITAILTASTSALVTRAVEHSLWLKLTPKPHKRDATVGEIYRLAQFSVSPIARLCYALVGDAWALRFAGLFLLGIAVLNPVLLSGILVGEHDSFEQTENRVTDAPFRNSGWIDGSSNAVDNGAQSNDVPGTLAALFSMSGQSAPPSKLCDGKMSCIARAWPVALQAKCTTEEISSSNLKLDVSGAHEICSTISNKVCVSFVSGSSLTIANFTSGPGAPCASSTNGTDCPSSFTTLFGVAMSYAGSSTIKPTLTTVDCAVSFGSVEIIQFNGSTPVYDRETFKPSTDPVSATQEMVNWNRIYTLHSRSPYSFSASSNPRSGTDDLFQSLIGYTLLSENPFPLGAHITQAFEDSFEMATLLAWTRSIGASAHKVNWTSSVSVRYRYHVRVLWVLLVPVGALVLGLWGRWRVGDASEVCGYDPLVIAGRGPVRGMEGMRWEGRHGVDGWRVRGWGRDLGREGSGDAGTGREGGGKDTSEVKVRDQGQGGKMGFEVIPS